MLKKIERNKRRLSSSALVSIFFLYFWINGPLNREEVRLSSTERLTGFAIPKLVGQESARKDADVLTIHKREESSTHGLLMNRPDKAVQSGLIKATGSYQAKSKRKEELIARASSFLKVDRNEIEIVDGYAISGSNIYFESSPNQDHIQGYAGPINVALALSLDNEIRKVAVLSSNETESYLRKIRKSGYYGQYDWLPFDRGEKSVDGVSGATITTHAVGAIVDRMIGQITADQPGYASTGSRVFSLTVINSLAWILHILFIVILFAYGTVKKVKKTKKGMLVVSTLSLIYIGFFLNNSFTYVSFMEPFVGASLSTFTGIYAFAVLLGAIWHKNTYCKYVCPFGHVQRLFIRIPFIKQRKVPIPNRWIDRIRNALTAVLTVGILLGMRQWKNYEIFPVFFGGSVFTISFLIALLIIIVSAIYPMLWCRMACPTGCILDTISKINK
ncbi:MAG: FMN-binding protein [Cytophagales bacterium]|nr:FMN-binding protein [Cytophagales bacterium]